MTRREFLESWLAKAKRPDDYSIEYWNEEREFALRELAKEKKNA